MVDVTADLKSLSFEAELTDGEKSLIYLRSRAAGLTFCGCAHAVFLCKLIQSLRVGCIRAQPANRNPVMSQKDRDHCVGILGMGHMGRQLLWYLLEKSGIKPSHIKISSREAETKEFIPTGVKCFFNNSRLAAWADILFLCCLPSDLPKVCAELCSHLSKHCLVYSFCSAVPVKRLAQLLEHDFILKPKYDYMTSDAAELWGSYNDTNTALTDSSLIEASCPLSMRGGISLDRYWVCAVLYSLLNLCTSAGLGSGAALSLINNTLQGEGSHTFDLNVHHFISASYASSLHPHMPFPWISLPDAQTKETPLQCFLSSSKPLQQCITAAYKSLLQSTPK